MHNEIPRGIVRLNRLLDRSAYGVMLFWCVVQCVAVTSRLPFLFLHESIGNGDSFIFQSVENLRKTGVLYPPLGADHLVPTLYSPFLYWMHAVAWAVIPTQNPYIGPRLLELVSFCGCVAAAALLSRRLLGRRGVYRLAVLLALSFSVVPLWVMQLRGDFQGITCSLGALYFLISRKPSGILWAGALAGLAVQFKVTFLAAAAAGCIWMLLYRRWMDLLRFVTIASVTSVGFYLFIWRLEPHIFQNILVLSKMIQHRAGVVVFIRQSLQEPVFLLAIAALVVLLPRIASRRWPRWQLLTIYLSISLAIAIVTSLQAGASINYFYESLFASVPFAVLGMLQLKLARLRIAGVFLSFLLLVILGPQAAKVVRWVRQAPAEVAHRNLKYDQLRQALEDTTVLSSIPDVTILRPERIIPDFILLNYMVMTAGEDVSGLEARIRKNDFDVIVTQPADYLWRGVPVLPRTVRSAIMDAYQPYCLLSDKEFHFPKNRPDTLNVRKRLQEIGCQVQSCQLTATCPGLGISVEAFKL
jgi:hypothetical protein